MTPTKEKLLDLAACFEAMAKNAIARRDDGGGIGWDKTHDFLRDAHRTALACAHSVVHDGDIPAAASLPAPAHAFKVGDRVRAKHSYASDWAYGTVSRINDAARPAVVLVSLGGGATHEFRADEIEPAPAQGKALGEAAESLSEGEERRHSRWAAAESRAEKQRLRDENAELRVERDTLRKCNAENIASLAVADAEIGKLRALDELARMRSDPSSHVFKVGDRVRVVNSKDDCFGKVGVVEEVDDEVRSLPYTVGFGRNRSFFHGDELRCEELE